MAQESTSIGTPAPHPVPHALHAGHPAPPVPSAESAPSTWGRVDEEGNVYVFTADGERQVGVWQAGTPDEGLVHYARRFDDVRTEVELLETRLGSGAGDPKHALSSATQIRDGLGEAAVVGDLTALAARLEYVIGHAEKALASAKQEREEARAAAVARKHLLAEEAEKLGLVTFALDDIDWDDEIRVFLDRKSVV